LGWLISCRTRFCGVVHRGIGTPTPTLQSLLTKQLVWNPVSETTNFNKITSDSISSISRDLTRPGATNPVKLFAVIRNAASRDNYLLRGRPAQHVLTKNLLSHTHVKVHKTMAPPHTPASQEKPLINSSLHTGAIYCRSLWRRPPRSLVY